MKKQDGQTMIEVLVALTTSVVIITSITAAVISALRNTEFSKNQNFATSYAQEGMEIIRSWRNTDYGTFNQLKNDYCFAKVCTALTTSTTNSNNPPIYCGPGPVCSQNYDIFVRDVAFNQNDPSCLGSPPITPPVGTKVTVTVSWADNQCTSRLNPFCHKVNVVSCFTDFTVLPTP
jgi:type II secretory pathway pseudopilin PulG